MKKHILLATAAVFAMTPALAQQTQDQQPAQDQQQMQSQPGTQTGTGGGLAGGEPTFDEVMASGELRAEDFTRLAAMGDLFEIESARLAEQQAEDSEVQQFAQRLIEDHRQAAQDLASAAEDANVQVAVLDQIESMTGTSGAGASTTTTGSVGTTGTTGTAPGGQSTTGASPDSQAATGTATETMSGGASTSGSTPGASGTSMGATAALDAEHQQKLDELRGLSGAEFDRRFMEMQIEAHEQAVSVFERFSENGQEEALRSHAEQTLPDLESHLEEAQSLMENLG